VIVLITEINRRVDEEIQRVKGLRHGGQNWVEDHTLLEGQPGALYETGSGLALLSSCLLLDTNWAFMPTCLPNWGQEDRPISFAVIIIENLEVRDFVFADVVHATTSTTFLRDSGVHV
jgi:hypothetical protein